MRWSIPVGKTDRNMIQFAQEILAFGALIGQEKPGKLLARANEEANVLPMGRIVFRESCRAFPGPLLKHGRDCALFLSCERSTGTRKKQ